MLIWNDDHRFKLVVSGRRFGKSRYAASEAIHKAFNYTGVYDSINPPAVILGAPTLKMCRRIFFRPLSTLLKNHPDVLEINRSEMIITPKGNRPAIHFVGMDSVNSDRLRGFRIYHINADEGQDVPKDTFDNVILPALIDTPGSTMTVTGTPKGEMNVLGQLKKRSDLDEKWNFFNFSTYDNPLIPEDEINNFKQLLPPEIFDQEIMAKFVNPPGQVYCHYKAGRNTFKQSEMPSLDKVFIGHDYGDVNPAWAVVGFSAALKHFYVIDAIDNRLEIDESVVNEWGNVSNNAIEEHEQMALFLELCSKYKVDKIFTGHDRPSRLMTIRRVGKEKNCLGMKNAVVGKPVPQTYTIINTLYYLGMLKISEKCLTKGLDKEIQSYHRKSKDGMILDEVEDKSKYHRLDAIAYAVGTLAIRYNLVFSDLGIASNNTGDGDGAIDIALSSLLVQH